MALVDGMQSLGMKTFDRQAFDGGRGEGMCRE